MWSLLLVVDMPRYRSQLKNLLTEWALSDGPNRKLMLEKTRAYIAACSIAQLNEEIKQVNSQRMLTLMSGASVPLGCRAVFLEQSRRVSKMKGPIINE